MALIPLSKEETELKPGKHAVQFVNATRRFSWIDYFDTEITSKEQKTLVATLIIPVENNAEADQIAATKNLQIDRSGNVTVSFTRKGKAYSFDFKNLNGGIVLIND
jgi:hypothetical protein